MIESTTLTLIPIPAGEDADIITLNGKRYVAIGSVLTEEPTFGNTNGGLIASEGAEKGDANGGLNKKEQTQPTTSNDVPFGSDLDAAKEKVSALLEKAEVANAKLAAKLAKQKVDESALAADVAEGAEVAEAEAMKPATKKKAAKKKASKKKAAKSEAQSSDDKPSWGWNADASDVISNW